jgi:outer membrane protein
MKGRGLVILGVALGLFLITTLVYAEEKLAYVNFAEIFAEYSKTKAYDKVLEKKQKDYEKQRETKVDEVKKLQEKLGLLSEVERESRKGDLEDKISKLQEFDRSATQDLRKERDEKVQEIFKNIQNAIKTYAKKEGMTLVFDKRALVYETESLDITNQILKILNKK